jgi:hypothetical protein
MSIRKYQRDSHWMDFRKIWYSGFYENLSEKFKFGWNRAKISDPLSEDISIFYCCRRRKIALCEGNGISLLVNPRRYEHYANAPLCYVKRTLSIFIFLLVWPHLICIIHIASFKLEYTTCKIWNNWPDCDYYRYVREFQSHRNSSLGVSFRSNFSWKKERQRRVPQKNAVECTKAKGR